MKRHWQVNTALAAAALCSVFAPQASACGNQTKEVGLNKFTASTSRLASAIAQRAHAPEAAAAPDNRASENSPMIVGMWEMDMYSGGVLFDHAIQQLFSDGNELQNSSLFPPEAGNVCFGVWKQQNARTFKLKHWGWIFDKGIFLGTYVMTATITVGTPAGPNTYFGNFVADMVLPSGKTDPAQHYEGTIQAKRLTIE